jgi:glutamate-1-semialdehyde 2,1-aminomutase
VIEAMQTAGAYERLYALGSRLREGLTRAAAAARVPQNHCGHGSVSAVHFASRRARRYEDLTDNDAARDVAFRNGLFDRGFACSTTPLRRFHLTLKHSDADIDRLCTAAEDVLNELKNTAA